MKILVNAGFEQYWREEFDRISEEFPNIEIVFSHSKEKDRKHLKTTNIYIGGYLKEEDIKSAENLKAIFVPWAGVDLLPIDIISKRNILVSNSHGNARIVAERAFSLALALLGKIPKFHNDLQKGIWHGFAVGFNESDLWNSMWDQKCTILGMGRIGKYLAKLLKGFDCKVTAFKRKIEDIPNVDYVTNNLEEAVDLSNIIFCILPLTKHTENIIDWNVLSKMKGKFFINVGRGKTVNERDLYRALKDGILAGAAIDVWYEYPNFKRKVSLPSNYPIHIFDNVVLSPHVGGYSIEGQVNRIKDTCDSLLEYLKTGTPKNLVDLKHGY